MDWIVAAVFLAVGVVAAVGIYLGQRDPSTRAYKPSIAGLFLLGRTAIRSDHGDKRDDVEQRDKEANGGRPGPGKS